MKHELVSTRPSTQAQNHGTSDRPQAPRSTPAVPPNSPNLRLGGNHPWQLRPSANYLAALREAERAIAQAILRRIVLRHTQQLTGA